MQGLTLSLLEGPLILRCLEKTMLPEKGFESISICRERESWLSFSAMAKTSEKYNESPQTQRSQCLTRRFPAKPAVITTSHVVTTQQMGPNKGMQACHFSALQCASEGRRLAKFVVFYCRNLERSRNLPRSHWMPSSHRGATATLHDGAPAS